MIMQDIQRDLHPGSRSSVRDVNPSSETASGMFTSEVSNKPRGKRGGRGNSNPEGSMEDPA